MPLGKETLPAMRPGMRPRTLPDRYPGGCEGKDFVASSSGINLDALLRWTKKHPYPIHTDGEKPMSNVRHIRDKSPDSEKITINLGFVDLGRIDLLVQEGFYSNRSDFIRTAIRNQLDSHGDAVARSIERHTMELGLRDYTRADLEAIRAAGEILHVKVVGLARIAQDVTPELALATIGSLSVLGTLQASADVKAALASRMV
jgi:Arc/MetJ-type ribon-helix-helix transcriptional regulator